MEQQTGATLRKLWECATFFGARTKKRTTNPAAAHGKRRHSLLGPAIGAQFTILRRGQPRIKAARGLGTKRSLHPAEFSADPKWMFEKNKIDGAHKIRHARTGTC